MYVDFEQIYTGLQRGVYRRIGSGSGRMVFDMGDGRYAVKAAKNRRGIAQNKTEHTIALDISENPASNNHAHIFAKTAGISNDNRLLIMEKAEKIYKMPEVWRCFKVRSNREFINLKEIKEIIKRYDLVPIDLIRAGSWGKIGGRCVVIDYGFTWKVKRKYYFPF